MFPNFKKALYGLKQAPRAWYARLKTFLLAKGFEMGSVDKLCLSSSMAMITFWSKFMWMISFFGSSNALVANFADTMSRERKHVTI